MGDASESRGARESGESGGPELLGYVLRDGLEPQGAARAAAAGAALGGLGVLRWVDESRAAATSAAALFAGGGSVRFTTRPADTGRCRRPVGGRVLGHLVSRTGGPAVALVDGVDAADVPWAFPDWQVGDRVDVVPMSAPASRCGSCWWCRHPVLERLAGVPARAVRWVRGRVRFSRCA